MSTESPQHIQSEHKSVAFHWKTAGATTVLCALLGCISVWVGAVYQDGKNFNTLNFHMDGLTIKYDLVENKRNQHPEPSVRNENPPERQAKINDGELRECRQDLIDKTRELAECLQSNNQAVEVDQRDNSCCHMRDGTDTSGVVLIGRIFYDPESSIHLVVNKWNNGLVSGNYGSRSQKLMPFDDHNVNSPLLIRGTMAEYRLSMYNYRSLGNGQGKFEVSLTRF